MSRVIVFSLLPFRTASAQSGPPYVSSTFLFCDPIDGHQLVVVPSPISISTSTISFFFSIFCRISCESIGHIILQCVTLFVITTPKGFSMREKGGRKNKQKHFLGLNPSSLHVSVCGKKKNRPTVTVCTAVQVCVHV